jgi:hypothetical protein
MAALFENALANHRGSASDRRSEYFWQAWLKVSTGGSSWGASSLLLNIGALLVFGLGVLLLYVVCMGEGGMEEELYVFVDTVVVLL